MLSLFSSNWRNSKLIVLYKIGWRDSSACCQIFPIDNFRACRFFNFFGALRRLSRYNNIGGSRCCLWNRALRRHNNISISFYFWSWILRRYSNIRISFCFLSRASRRYRNISISYRLWSRALRRYSNISGSCCFWSTFLNSNWANLFNRTRLFSLNSLLSFITFLLLSTYIHWYIFFR